MALAVETAPCTAAVMYRDATGPRQAPADGLGRIGQPLGRIGGGTGGSAKPPKPTTTQPRLPGAYPRRRRCIIATSPTEASRATAVVEGSGTTASTPVAWENVATDEPLVICHSPPPRFAQVPE